MLWKLITKFLPVETLSHRARRLYFTIPLIDQLLSSPLICVSTNMQLLLCWVPSQHPTQIPVENWHPSCKTAKNLKSLVKISLPLIQCLFTLFLLLITYMVDLKVHDYNPSTWEIKRGGSGMQNSWPGWATWYPVSKKPNTHTHMCLNP